MASVTFQVPGKPQGKARARTVHNPYLKHSISYTPENDLLYENLIKTLYMQAAGGIRTVAKKAYSAVEGLDITVEEYTDGR